MQSPSTNELLVVPANDIDTTGLPIASPLPVEWLEAQLHEAEAHAAAPGTFSGRLSRSGKADIVVRGKLACSLTLPCARCLEPTGFDVAAELSLLLRPRRASSGDHRRGADHRADAGHTPGQRAGGRNARSVEYEFSSEEAELDDYDGERVVLDGFVREAILLELPSFPLCKETCEGVPEAETPGKPPLLRSQPDPRPSEPRRPPGEGGPSDPVRNPFEVLRHMFAENPLPSGDSQGNSARPSAREVRRAARTLQRDKPKIRSSMTGRKKS